MKIALLYVQLELGYFTFFVLQCMSNAQRDYFLTRFCETAKLHQSL